MASVCFITDAGNCTGLDNDEGWNFDGEDRCKEEGYDCTPCSGSPEGYQKNKCSEGYKQLDTKNQQCSCGSSNSTICYKCDTECVVTQTIKSTYYYQPVPGKCKWTSYAYGFASVLVRKVRVVNGNTEDTKYDYNQQVNAGDFKYSTNAKDQTTEDCEASAHKFYHTNLYNNCQGTYQESSGRW